MLRSNKVLLSFAATSTAGFVGISPKGRGMDAGYVTSAFNCTHLHVGFRTKEFVTEMYFEEIFKVISNQCLNTDILLLNNRLRFYSKS